MAGYFYLRSNASGAFNFSLKAGNHEVILSSQSYETKRAALAGIESVKKNSQIEGRFERKVAKDNSPYFTLLASNGQVIGTSEMYSSRSAMESGIKSVMRNGAINVMKGLD